MNTDLKISQGEVRASPQRCWMTGKRAFRSQAEAEEHATAELAKPSRSYTTAKAFRCEACGEWHLATRYVRRFRGKAGR